MRKLRGNGERMRKWREIYSLHFLILSWSQHQWKGRNVNITGKKMLSKPLLAARVAQLVAEEEM